MSREDAVQPMTEEKTTEENTTEEKTTEENTTEEKTTEEKMTDAENRPAEEKMAALEAILFAMGKEVSLKTLAAAIGEEPNETRAMLEEMARRKERDDSGVRLIRLEDGWQLSTKREMYDYLVKAAVQPKKQVLTDAVLETLSIIAYRQPVTRSQIEKIRGVKCDHAINKLIEYGLIEEKGRLEAPGRPILFGTNEEFLRRFGMPDLSALPTMSADREEEIRLEAEEEIALKSND